MKNIKELKAILTTIYCLNMTSYKDKEITYLINYAFENIFKSNTRYLNYVFADQSKEKIIPVLEDYLADETKIKRIIAND